MFTDRVQKQISRLGGRLPEDFEPKEWTVATPAGERRVPDWAQALFVVDFTAGDLRADDYSEYLVDFYETPVEPGYFEEERTRAWHGIGHRGDYYCYVADLDDTSADPIVHALDLEGGDDALGSGTRLSALLADLKVVTPPGEGDRFALACSAGDVAAANEELALGAGLGPLDDTGLTPLHLSVMSRRTDLVRVLLQAGADARAAIAYDTQAPWTYLEADTYVGGDLEIGTTALHLALDGDLPRKLDQDEPVDELVRLLLDAGADPDASDGIGWTPMLLAAGSSPQLVRLMLAAGADPNLTGKLRPPLVAAASGGDANEEVVRLLLAAGGDANSAGKDGTALAVAAGNDSTTILRILLDAGADPNRPNPPGCWMPGHTPLHSALGRKANMELLLASGADPNARTPDGLTPLIATLLRFHLADPVETVTLLVQAGAEVDAAVDEATVRGYVSAMYKPKKPLADLTATTPRGIAQHLGMTRTAAYLT